MPDVPAVRPLTGADVAATQELAELTFDDLAVRNHHPAPPMTMARRAWFHRRVQLLLKTDPALQWAFDGPGGRLDGVALALDREGLWGLSLLVVRPGTQSAGLGRLLIDAALGGHSGPGVICASSDGRALHRYAAAGFALHPMLRANGTPLIAAAADPRVARVELDVEFADAVDRQVRGAARGAPDHELLSGHAGFALRYEDGDRRGYAIVAEPGFVAALSATDEVAAQALLWAALAQVREAGMEAEVEWLTAGQQWAIDVAVAAKLQLAVDGAMCWRGRPEPSCYLPNGALL